MAHKIDYNKVERIETPYGNGYAYGGRIYSDKQWKDILDFNAGGTIVPGGYSDKTGTYDGFGNHMIAGPEGEIQTENQYRNAINYGDSWNSDKPWGTKTPEQAQYFKDMKESATRNKVIDNNGNIINPKGFKRGGRKEGEMSDAENEAYNLEMGIDDASVRADEAAINASKDTLEQSYSDKNDAAEADRIARYSSASEGYDDINTRDVRIGEASYAADKNQRTRNANPVSEQVSRGTGVAKGFFDETGDAENAPVSLINNQTTYKKPVKKQKEEEIIDMTGVTDMTGKVPNSKTTYDVVNQPGYKAENEEYGNKGRQKAYIDRIGKATYDTLKYDEGYTDKSFDAYISDLDEIAGKPGAWDKQRREIYVRNNPDEQKRISEQQESDKLWAAFTKSHPGITSRHYYDASVGGTSGTGRGSRM
jgi:hypothetical protein